MKNVYACHEFLINLENIPEFINGNFDCSFNKLSNLKGGPKFVKGNFDCNTNQLITLREGPRNVMYTASYDCFENRLTSLIYAPKIINNFYYFENHLLTLDYF